jgi:hypothetical protein
MAAHLRPRAQTTTNRKGQKRLDLAEAAAGKCSGLLGGMRINATAPEPRAESEE